MKNYASSKFLSIPCLSSFYTNIFLFRTCLVPSSAALKADYSKKVELSKKIRKACRNPIGVVRMIKDPALKCELETSLQLLPVSPRNESSLTKNAVLIGATPESKPSVNIHSVKSSYYNAI